MYYNFLFIQRKYIVSKNLIFNMIKKLKNKAKNLDILAYIFKNKKNIIILNNGILKKKEFYKKKNFFLKKISLFNKKKHTIVRSSATDEDQNNYSLAGKYNSLIIKKKTKYNLIEKELENYLKQFKNANDLIIIQKRIINVNSSGVLFSTKPSFRCRTGEIVKIIVTSGLKNFRIEIIDSNKKGRKVEYKPEDHKLEKILTIATTVGVIALLARTDRVNEQILVNKGFLKDSVRIRKKL